MIVVDASVAVKLYRAEMGSDAALSLIEAHAGDMRVPDIFAIEVAGAIVRETKMRNLDAAEGKRKLNSFVAMLDSATLAVLRSTPHHVNQSATLAINLGHPLKDCIYLALAMELGCELVTCDALFAAKARGVWERVRVLGE